MTKAERLTVQDPQPYSEEFWWMYAKHLDEFIAAPTPLPEAVEMVQREENSALVPVHEGAGYGETLKIWRRSSSFRT